MDFGLWAGTLEEAEGPADSHTASDDGQTRRPK